jgi:hypothetical protein
VRAGEPNAACATVPRIQRHNTGTAHAVAAFLDHILSSFVMEGILSFHDYEQHNKGDETAWKSSGHGPGKMFTKEELDKEQSGE